MEIKSMKEIAVRELGIKGSQFYYYYKKYKEENTSFA